MSRPSFTNLKLKQNFEESVLSTFKVALTNLVNEEEVPKAENEINRLLHRLADIASHREVWTIQSECNNQPNFDSPKKEKREDKRPDFTCSYKDSLEEDPLKSTKRFTLECKRLGDLKISGNYVNELYVLNGIKRFIDKDHGYGEMSKSGAMIGYVQSMNLEDVLQEVNLHGATHLINDIELDITGWQVKNVSSLKHELERPEIAPSPFKLHHMWVDLR